MIKVDSWLESGLLPNYHSEQGLSVGPLGGFALDFYLILW